MPKGSDIDIKVNRRTIRSIGNDAAKAAEAVHLVYISDQKPGIERVKKGKGYAYFYKNEKITDQEKIKRIKSLVIPPAWEKVWISPLKNSHLQVTGYDTKLRKQYIYHPLWIALRSKTKFHKLYQFGKTLPLIRKNLQKDLRLHGLSRRKVLAALVSLMEKTNIRVGNEAYEKLYGSRGLSTLKDQNVQFNGSKIRFTFIGKKGVKHDISIRSKRLAKIVRRCREIPGEELFQYFDGNDEAQTISSGDVNEYIKEISGEDFTSKDFRTWEGSVECIKVFKETGFGGSQPRIKKNIVSAIDKVAENLGNTRSICKKYYIHPLIFTTYENGQLENYVNRIKKGSKWMECEERILMEILK